MLHGVTSANTRRMPTRNRIANVVLGSIALIMAALVCIASFAPFTPAVFLAPIMLAAALWYALLKHVRVAVASLCWSLATVVASPMFDFPWWLIASAFLTALSIGPWLLVDYWRATRSDP